MNSSSNFFAYIHKELSEKGVTLTLLWQEYCETCRTNGQQPYMNTQFYDKYRRWVSRDKSHHCEHCASLSLLNSVYGAQVAPQRCPIFCDGYNHFYDTTEVHKSQCTTAPTRVFSLLRRRCSVSNGTGVQRERYIHTI